MNDETKKYKPKDFAELIGVPVKTLQGWDKMGVLVAHRTNTDRRYYTHEQYLDYKENGVKGTANKELFNPTEYHKEYMRKNYYKVLVALPIEEKEEYLEFVKRKGYNSISEYVKDYLMKELNK